MATSWDTSFTDDIRDERPARGGWGGGQQFGDGSADLGKRDARRDKHAYITIGDLAKTPLDDDKIHWGRINLSQVRTIGEIVETRLDAAARYYTLREPGAAYGDTVTAMHLVGPVQDTDGTLPEDPQYVEGSVLVITAKLRVCDEQLELVVLSSHEATENERLTFPLECQVAKHFYGGDMWHKLREANSQIPEFENTMLKKISAAPLRMAPSGGGGQATTPHRLYAGNNRTAANNTQSRQQLNFGGANSTASLRDKIMGLLQKGTPDCGLHINTIASSIGCNNMNTLLEACRQLADEGAIYTAMNDEHYRSC